MLKHRVATVVALLSLASPAVAGQQAASTLALADVRPGQRGTGLTVIEGTEPAVFEVEVLGVLHDVFPDLDLIVARLSGLGLERSGVAAGMSGSPVYVDGRLVGAVAYRLIDFGHEAIAGIVPIDAMLALQRREETRLAALRVPVDALLPAAAALIVGDRPDAVMGLPAPVGAPGVRPIATPLGFGGFAPELVQAVQPLLDRLGWTAAAAGATGEAGVVSNTVVPGGAFGVQLMRGDMNVTATGTVTHVDGNSVYGFGHPFMQGGAVRFPMVGAEVITLLSSSAASQKLSATGNTVIGTLVQDRLPGVLGTLGDAPGLIPVSLEARRGDDVRRLNFELVDDVMLTPLYLFFGIANALQSIESVYGEGAIEVSARIGLEDSSEDVELGSLFGDRSQAIVGVAAWLSGMFASLRNNDLEAASITGVEVDLAFREGNLNARLLHAWPSRSRVAPGETLEVLVELRPFRGAAQRHRIEIQVPADLAPGTAQLVVGDGESYLDALSAAGAAGGEPDDLSGLVQRLNGLPRADRLYAVLSRAVGGAQVDGEPLPALPPSLLDTLTTGGSAESVSRLSRQLLGWTSLDVGLAIAGSSTMEIEVRKR